MRVFQTQILLFPDKMETCSNTVWYVISKNEDFSYSACDRKFGNSSFDSYTSKSSFIPYDKFHSFTEYIILGCILNV